MIVEDDKLLLEAIGKKMEANSIPVKLYNSGKEALDVLESGKFVPDAIWLDYYLGDMNGLEFLQFIKNDKKYDRIPVVVVSNSADDEHVHNMLALGADRYLLKAEYRMQDIIDMLIDLAKKNG